MYNIKDDCFKNSHPMTLDVKCTSTVKILYCIAVHSTITWINKERITRGKLS
jgi:hypothetical protein